MEYGCIGETLKHSFSKQIHNKLTSHEYELIELSRDEVPEFLEKKDFKAINVTIPYKETVIPYLAEIDKHAETIGSVNTIVNKDGKLYGYNTDFYGMSMLAQHAGVDFFDKKVLVLGSGGTSKTAAAVANAMGASEVITVSRKKSKDSISYESAIRLHKKADVIINTTPVGMYPKILGQPIEISKFTKLSGVLDAVYNPLCTPLILEAKKLGIPCAGGLYMLIAQGVRASEIFHNATYPEGTVDRIFSEIERDNKNIVLVGMPASGKSTVGKLIAKALDREFIDTDTLIEERSGLEIPHIFEARGEAAFRDIESSVILGAASKSGVVIATGGGAILRGENISALKENGKVYFVDRPLEMLIPTEDRPLSSTKEDIERRYHERYNLYLKHSDVKIDASVDAEAVCEEIIRNFTSV